MKALIYPAVALVFNIILFNSFPMAGGGVSIGALLTIPVIGLISLLLTLTHYLLRRKKNTTKYFQPIGITLTVLISYFLFITDEGNTPIDIMGRMFKTARNYNKIKLTDFYLDDIPSNAERILATKKKFKDQIPDTAYTINIFKHNDYKTIETFGIFYKNGKPIAINENVKIRQINRMAIMLTRIAGQDSLSFVLSPLTIKLGESRISGFPEENPKRKPEESLRQADINPVSKRITLDQQYFAYKVFYWLL
ncbi:hypothetical protein J7E50_04050 [Pedobacter sp. ISL-68]|uniref:hypothetical protein n=1 Tax=unclassified Pedobacter TaxID=2628915 RepID=UPI001BEAA9EE|nr:MULTISPECIES: hypothetical protein [unclassified Pedobacter]MBT2560396.1 hypothetical protein [Pedobacter sp. ISL-64]MBT2589376.1 hypothetical protein [Pedobacter sp. ISL-68]